MDEFRIKIDMKIDNLTKTVDSINTRVIEANHRTAKLEKWQSFIQGALLVISVLIAPVVIRVVSHIFNINI